MSQKESSIPQHVAIMLDGNRRWALKRGLKPWEGHIAGIGDNAEKVVRYAADIGIEYLTLWAGSYDNFTNRSEIEIRFLNRAYREFIDKALSDDSVFSDKVKVSFIGEWQDLLEKETIESIEDIQRKTESHNNLRLTILVGYNGDREMLNAINRLIDEGKQSVTSEVLKSYLWTADMPPIDLMIRTGVEGDPHNSAGFMMWDMRDAQFNFSEILWPDFTKDDLKSALEDFSSRQRRLGK